MKTPMRGCCVVPNTRKLDHLMLSQTEPGQPKLQIGVTNLGHGCASRFPERHFFVINFK